MPPKPGMIPRLTSGWPKVAERAARRMSQAIAISQPPPNASPLTAAIVVIGDCSHSRESAWMRSRCARPESASHLVKALMSAPAQKSAGLAEASTIARAPLASTSPQAEASASITSGESEFAGGFASQTIATSPRCSNCTGASPETSGCG